MCEKTERVVICNHCGSIMGEHRLLEEDRERCPYCGKGDALMDMHCSDCGKEILHIVGDFATGYASDWNEPGRYVCYSCAAERDKKSLRETGTMQGYLSYEGQPIYGRARFDTGFQEVVNGKFTNWPGSFVLTVATVKRSVNNFGANRDDFWVTFEGKTYHGVHVGNSNQIATIKVVKGKRR